MIQLSNGSLSINWKIFKAHLYTIKQDPGNSFCLND